MVMPDPVGHPNIWIQAQRDRSNHPHWWKEITALHRPLVTPNLSKPEALLLSQWHTTDLMLPLAPYKTSGYWETPPYLTNLCPWDLPPHINSLEWGTCGLLGRIKPSPHQSPATVCRKAPAGVLYNAAQELQRWMAPLMCLNRDEIMEVLLLEPTDEKARTSPILEEEAALLGEEMELYLSCLPSLGAPEPEKLTEKFDAPSTPASSSRTPTSPWCHGDPSQKTMRSHQRTDPQSLLILNSRNTSKWVWALIEKNGEIPDWWQEFWFLHHMGDKILSKWEGQDLARRQVHGLLDTQGPTRKGQLVGHLTLPGQGEMRRFPPSIIQALPGHQGGKEGPNGGTDSGPPEVCWVIRCTYQVHAQTFLLKRAWHHWGIMWWYQTLYDDVPVMWGILNEHIYVSIERGIKGKCIRGRGFKVLSLN